MPSSTRSTPATSPVEDVADSAGAGPGRDGGRALRPAGRDRRDRPRRAAAARGADRRLRRGRPDGRRVPQPGPAWCSGSATAHGAPDAALARRVFVLARQRTIDQDPAFAHPHARRHRHPRAVAGRQRPDDRGAVARPDRGAARRARPAPPRPVVRGRRRRDAARARARAAAGPTTSSSGWSRSVATARDSPQIVRRLTALYDRLGESPTTASGPGSSSSAGCCARPSRGRSPTTRSARSSSGPTGSGSAARASRRPRPPGGSSPRRTRRPRCRARRGSGCPRRAGTR